MDFGDNYDYAYGMVRENGAKNPFAWYTDEWEDDDDITYEDILDVIESEPDMWICEDCELVGLDEMLTLPQHRHEAHAVLN